ncbi:isocitrate dehydrogenase (NADP(+)) [Anaerospora hongkongensis]|uniref:isocitrate dehydrogenase (NADP(+)) n=1 Tax=Anaerospora hongkongensis TaxID=244830 RepID=UPI0028A09207|nr:isocitrate dehydrogenase (NADP(+)) [Anaerospora hongkongensis]
MSEKIKLHNGSIRVPDHPVIPCIAGDGTGPEIWAAASSVIDAAIDKVYNGTRRINWLPVLAGERAYQETGSYLPNETLAAIKECVVAIKGPLGTPIGGGFRSINVTLRKELNLYACIRPVKWVPGTPSPVVRPDLVDIVIFRENIEDVYAGIEWPADSGEAVQVTNYLNQEMKCRIPEGAGIGIKFLSKEGTERIMRKALQYAEENGRRTVTIVHKGNIMKYTEGAFKTWCYQLAKSEFGHIVITEEELAGKPLPAGKILINDRIADNMFQQILLRSGDYDILVCPNLNGDYLSDAIAAQVGGLGMAPGANVGDGVAIFEATHGNAPKYAGLDKVNPGSVILSAVMMLRYMHWHEAAEAVTAALTKTIQQKTVTYDLARGIEGAEELSTSQFAAAIIANL